MKTSHAFALTLTAVAITAAIQEFRIASLRSENSKSISQVSSASPKTTDTGTATADNSAPKIDRTDTRRPRPENEPTKEPLEETIMETTRKMWDNPAGKSIMNQSLKFAASMMYQDFIDGLNLTKEESEYFTNLLISEMAKQQEIGMKMMGATKEERSKLGEEMLKVQKQTEADIKKFLNNEEDYQNFQNYKNRYPERQQLEGIRAVMKDKNVTMDQQTESKLVEAMFKARSTPGSSEMQQQLESLSALEDGNMVEFFEKNWQNQQDFLNKETASFLNQEQREAFQEYQKQFKEMQLSGLRMAEKMMKKKDE